MNTTTENTQTTTTNDTNDDLYDELVEEELIKNQGKRFKF